jgi:2-haloacid dehalogenase
MTALPAVVVLDVNETLSDLSPLAERFADVGAPRHLLPTWFASVLRDGFALTAAGATAAFGDIAAAVLRMLLPRPDLDRDLDAAVEHVLAGLPDLDVHPDVPGALRQLHEAGIRLVTLTNGATAMSRSMFERAGVADLLEVTMSVQDAGAWKPAARAYRYAAERCDVAPAALMLVAVHPWDIDGAKRAGLRAAWVDRDRQPYPPYFQAPDVTGPDMGAVAAGILGTRPGEGQRR